jgi:hypothetical protein
MPGFTSQDAGRLIKPGALNDVTMIWMELAKLGTVLQAIDRVAQGRSFRISVNDFLGMFWVSLNSISFVQTSQSIFRILSNLSTLPTVIDFLIKQSAILRGSF